MLLNAIYGLLSLGSVIIQQLFLALLQCSSIGQGLGVKEWQRHSPWGDPLLLEEMRTYKKLNGGDATPSITHAIPSITVGLFILSLEGVMLSIMIKNKPP